MVKVINQSTGQIREVSESVASSGALELSGWVRHNTPRTPLEIAEKFNEIIDDIENEDVPRSEAFVNVRDTPWTRWIKSWYTRRFRFLSQCIYSSD